VRFRLNVGDAVRVLTHPAQPPAVVVERWEGRALDDPYDENIYAVSGFVTRQRETSLVPVGWVALSLDSPGDWRTAGQARFPRVAPGTVATEGGPGVLWWSREEFEDFLLLVDWRVPGPDAVAAVLLRLPPLADAEAGRGPADWRTAVAEGWQIPIPPAPGSAAETWHTFALEARGSRLAVTLDGAPLWEREGGPGRRLRGHVGFLADPRGPGVRFRNPQLRPL